MNRTQELLSLFIRKASPDVVEWLEGNIRLPRQFTRTPGAFRTAGRPFQKEILGCFHPESGVTDCTFSGGTQLAKTAVLLLGLAYRLVNSPMSALLVGTSRDFQRLETSQERLQPLINHNPVLAAMKPDDPDEFSDLEMKMRGGTLSLAGANSPGGLAGRARGMVLQDECCKYIAKGSEQAPESHPMKLADSRCKDYGPTAFRYKSSSPNTETHLFWSEFYLQGDQTQFYVPCPNCGNRNDPFPLEWIAPNDDEKDGYRSLVWDQDARDKNGVWIEQQVKESARYLCPHCAYPIQSHEKAAIIAKYEPVRTNPSASPSNRSFIASSFYAPNITFGTMAWEYIKSQTLFGQQDYWNSWLALPWSEITVRVEDDDVRAMVRDDYRRGQVFSGMVSILLGADPGETSGTHWLAAAVAPNEEIFICDWGVCLGVEDLSVPQKQVRLKERVADKLTGRVAVPERGLTDSGYASERVYNLCAHSGGFWHPTRGMEGQSGHYTQVAITSHPGLRLTKFVDKTLKDELYARRIARKKPPRIWLPADADESLISQLSGQRFDAKTNKWVKRPNDHYGDCLKQIVLWQWIRRSWKAATRHAPSPSGNRARGLPKGSR